ncbi:hypothetical protein VUR80DRAFT_3157 [Thermomyces stellatus]
MSTNQSSRVRRDSLLCRLQGRGHRAGRGWHLCVQVGWVNGCSLGIRDNPRLLSIVSGDYATFPVQQEWIVRNAAPRVIREDVLVIQLILTHSILFGANPRKHSPLYSVRVNSTLNSTTSPGHHLYLPSEPDFDHWSYPHLQTNPSLVWIYTKRAPRGS